MKRFFRSRHGIRSDEEVLLFPTVARLSPDGGEWIVPLRGWLFEPERNSLWRTLTIEWTRRRLRLHRDVIRSGLFAARSRMFLVDNERGRQLHLHLAGHVATSSTSEPNGHFHATLRLPRSAAAPGDLLRVSSDPRARDGRRFEGDVLFPPADAFGVISDIDDTVKVTGVLRPRRDILADTFSKPFEAYPGMVRAATHLHARGASYFYVSTSPWQLYPSLEEWRRTTGLPPGEFHLRHFRVKDRTGASLFADPADFKRPVIEGILADFPGWTFVLSGDTTQQDPRIFADITARHPGRIREIWLHDTGRSDPAAIRALFSATPDIPLHLHNGDWRDGAFT